MSKIAEQAWALIEQLPTTERQAIRDRLVEQMPYGEDDSTLEAELFEAARRMARMLDAEENEARAR